MIIIIIIIIIIIFWGPDYMANFSPGWNFNLRNWAEILLRLPDGLQPGLKLWASAPKYEIACEESQENQTGAENTNRENRRIASLTFWSFGGTQFSIFLDGNSLQDDGTVFGCISLS